MTHTITKPKALAPGSTIGIVTPSEPVNEEDFNRALSHLEGLGFRLRVGPHARERRGHLAGNDEQRAADLMAMFQDDTVDAIFCAAGGANSGRLLPLLNYDAIRAHPKVLLGMSDPTALLCGIHARTGLITFHGPVVQYNMQGPMPAVTDHYFQRALFTNQPVGVVQELGNKNVLRPGKAQGRLIGGNLTTLQQLLGTPYEPHWDGAILFCEEVCELHKILDAKLTHLRNAGVFQRIAGMIVGVLESCDEHDYTNMPTLPDIILELTTGRTFPIIIDVPLGHTDDKITLPIGAMVAIDTNSSVLSLLESGVE